MGRSLSLKRAALRAFGEIENDRVKKVVRLWLRILEANLDLRAHVADAIDVLDGNRTAADVSRQRQLVEADIAQFGLVSLADQDAANDPMNFESAAEDQSLLADMRAKLAAQIANNSGIADMSATESREEY
ncbi:unnamed protein product [Discula destructiva]